MPYLPLDVPPPAEPEALDALANACLAAAEEHHTVAVGLQGVFESLSAGPERWQGHASLTYHDAWGSVGGDIARTAEALTGLAARLRWFAGAIRMEQNTLRAALTAAAPLGPAAQEAARAAAEAAFLALDAQMGAALAELLAAIPLTRLHLGFLGGVIAEPAKTSAAEAALPGLASGGPLLTPTIPQPPNTPMGPITYVAYNSGESVFQNKLPERLKQELADAKRLGVEPMEVSITDPRFADIANEGTIKWVVLQNGELRVAPKFVRSEEISHAVLSGGDPVLAAGEADIAIGGGRAICTSLTNHSGHFEPSEASLEIGREAFKRSGVEFRQPI